MEIILPHTYFLADKDLETINVFPELQGNDEIFCASSWAKNGMTKSTYTALNISMPQCATCSPTKFQYSSKIRPLVAISLTRSMLHLLLHIWAELMPCSLPVLWHIVTKNVEEIPQMWECPRIGHYERAGEWMSRNEYSASVFPPNSSSG